MRLMNFLMVLSNVFCDIFEHTLNIQDIFYSVQSRQVILVLVVGLPSLILPFLSDCLVHFRVDSMCRLLSLFLQCLESLFGCFRFDSYQSHGFLYLYVRLTVGKCPSLNLYQNILQFCSLKYLAVLQFKIMPLELPYTFR